MIQYRNVDNWKLINYQGHDIKAAYSNLGKIWEKGVALPKWEATYTTGTSSAACDASSVITSGDGFNKNSELISIIIGECINEIGNYAFSACTSLSSVTIPNSVTSIGTGAFRNCTSLSSVTIPSGVTSIGGNAFSNCTSLTSCTIGNNVTSIGSYAFNGCSSLTSVTIPSSVTSISAGTFQNCSGLTSVTVEATTPPTLGRNSFNNTNDCPIYVPCESVDAYKAASGWSAYTDRIYGIPPCGQPTFEGKFKLLLNDSSVVSAECDSTNQISISEISAYTGSVVSAEIGQCVTSIGTGAFLNCNNLTSVTIPNSITTIKQNAFGYCSSLTSIDIPSGVTTIEGSVFNHCESLTSIDIPSGVTSIGNGAFSNCGGLTSITIPSGVTTIGMAAFSFCTSLTSVTISSGATSIGTNAFAYCTSLTSITCLATTPPTLDGGAFDNTNNCPIYVPSGSVESYKVASGWSAYATRIQAIP